MKKNVVSATILLAMTLCANAQNVVTNVTAPVRLTYTPWFSGIAGGMRVATSEGIEYNTTTKKWVYINNATQKYFSSTFIGEGEINFLSSVHGSGAGGTEMTTIINNGTNADMINKFTRFNVEANGNGNFGGDVIRMGCNTNVPYAVPSASFTKTGKTAFQLYNNNLVINPLGNFAGTIFSNKVTIGSGLNLWDAKFATDATLSVQGKIYCAGVKVQLAANWADYVFAKEYQLNTLAYLETYIAQNHHLPNVPSAAEVKEDGLAVEEMQRIQMEKIEELTLYLIEQNKKIEALESKIEELTK